MNNHESNFKAEELFDSLKNGQMKYLLHALESQPEITISIRDDDGKTALMYAATFANVTEAKLLIDAGADVNAKDDKGDTALMLATSIPVREAAGMVELLIGAGALIDDTNNDGDTALMLAVLYRNVAQTKALLDVDADTSIRNIDGKNVYDLAIDYYSAEITSLLNDKLLWQNHGHTIVKKPVLVESGELAF